MQAKPLTLKDFQKASLIHFSTLSDISSLCGLAIVNKLYKKLISDDDHFCRGIWNKKDLVAFITVSYDMNKSETAMHDLFSFSDILGIFIKIITGKLSPWRIMQRLVFENSVKRNIFNKYSSIVTLCVADKFQRKGIGKRLVKTVIMRLKEKNINYLYVDTREENQKALNFYKSLGFKIVLQSAGGILLKIKLK